MIYFTNIIFAKFAKIFIIHFLSHSTICWIFFSEGSLIWRGTWRRWSRWKIRRQSYFDIANAIFRIIRSQWCGAICRMACRCRTDNHCFVGSFSHITWCWHWLCCNYISGYVITCITNTEITLRFYFLYRVFISELSTQIFSKCVLLNIPRHVNKFIPLQGGTTNFKIVNP